MEREKEGGLPATMRRLEESNEACDALGRVHICRRVMASAIAPRNDYLSERYCDDGLVY